MHRVFGLLARSVALIADRATIMPVEVEEEEEHGIGNQAMKDSKHDFESSHCCGCVSKPN